MAMRLHPLIRILCFIVFAALLPRMSTQTLVLILTALAAGAVVFGAAARVWRGIVAVKWLVAALMLVYLAFTPGDPLLPWLPGFSREGAAYGTFRALLLLDLVAAIAVLIGPVPPPELAAGLLMLLYPLRWLRIPVERIGIRIGLALVEIEALLSQVRATAKENRPMLGFAELCRRIETRAVEPFSPDFDPPALQAPALLEWSLPAVLAFILLTFGT